MTPGDFLNEFGAVANAPGGVQRLREMILQLAVQGKLVEQNPKDEPASELLKRIEAEKLNLVKTREIKNQKPIPIISDVETPYDIPESWKWCRLGEIGIVGSSSRVYKKDWTNEGIPFLRAREIVLLSKSGYVDNELFISEELYSTLSKNGLVPQPDDIMLTGVGTIGVPYIVKQTDNFYFKDASVLIFKNYFKLFPSFLFVLLKTPYWNKKIHEGSMGTTVHTLTISRANETPIPLPPLAEQKRIVTKVDQLMALCDQLEAQQQKRSTLVKHTRISALEALANAQRGNELLTAWKRVEENLPLLFEHPDDVEDLKKCTLQNAVMGKLVRQNPHNEPASELLKKIAKEKAEQIKKGEIKKQNPLPEIREDEKPFEIPVGWEWVQFGKIANTRLGKMLDKSKNRGLYKYYLRNTNVQWHEFILDDLKKMKFEESEFAEFKIKSGDLLICEGGEPGRCAIWSDDSTEIYFQKALHRARPYKGVITMYLLYCLTLDAKNRSLEQYFTGATIKHFPGNKLMKYILPLPPTPEQKRIVKKTQSLLSLCDTLQKQLAKSRKVAEQLAQSIVESITGISTEKQEKMKTPKTELVTKLKLVKKPGTKDHAPLSAILAKNNDELSAKALWNHSGLPIDGFYRQLKIEMMNNWIIEPQKAEVHIVEAQG